MKTLQALLLAMLPVAALAQETTLNQPFTFGVQAGATYSSFRGNDFTEMSDPRVNFLVGVSADIPVGENLSIYANLNFEQKAIGEKGHYYIIEDGVATEYDLDVTQVFQFLSIPVTAKYRFTDDFYFYGGPFAGALLGRNIYDSGKKIDSGKEPYKTLDYGLTFGLGFKIPFDTNSLNVELRDNLGLANISGPSGLGTVKTNSVNLIVAWQFTL